MNDNSKYLQWIKSLPSQDVQYKETHCPSCNSAGLLYQYFGFPESNIGWKIVWCPICLDGIRFVQKTEGYHRGFSFTVEYKGSRFSPTYETIQERDETYNKLIVALNERKIGERKS